MRPLELTMKGFGAWRNATIDFRDMWCVVVSGENGSGKSMIWDGILFALYGECTKAGVKELDELVNWNDQECQVDFTFAMQGKTYRIVRGWSKARSKSTLEVFELHHEGMMGEWKAISDKKSTDTQAFIERVITRMDYKTFVASVIILQGQAEGFTQARDEERRSIVANILGLDAYAELRSIVQAEAKDLKAAESHKKAELERLVSSAEDPESVRAALKDVNEALALAKKAVKDQEDKVGLIQRKAASVEMQKQHLADLQRQGQKSKDEIERVKGEIEDCQRKIAGISAVVAREAEIRDAAEQAGLWEQILRDMEEKLASYEDIQAEIHNLERSEAKWQSDYRIGIERLQSSIKNSQELAADLTKAPCSKCEYKGHCADNCSYLSRAREATKNLALLDSQLAKVEGATNPYTEERQTLVEVLKTLDYDPESHKDARAEYNKVREPASMLPTLDSAKRETSGYQERTKALEQTKSNLSADIVGRMKELKETEEKAKEAPAIAAQLAEEKKNLDAENDELSRCQRAVGQLSERLKQAEARVADISRVREELAQTQESLNINALLDKAFSTKDGAPNMIIRNATPELERLTNEMLATLMGGRYQVHFLLTQEGKSTSTEQSVFKVKVYDMGRERSIRTCSGAERFIINLAIRRAMGKFLTSRAGSEVRMFVLDEGIGCTDAKNKEAIVSALLQVASDFDCMFVVTHLEDLKSEFPQRLEIKNTPTGSCAELVS